MQRQAVNAFLSLASQQSFQAWVLLRPCLESCLNDPANAAIWSNKEEDWKTYNKTFQGKSLHSASLPRADEIQTVLKTINGDFLHTNPRYYDRHTDVVRVDDDNLVLQVQYFDDEREHLCAYLRLPPPNRGNPRFCFSNDWKRDCRPTES